MKLLLSIDTANAAFDDDAGGEVARILHEAADRFDLGPVDSSGVLDVLHDANGNSVGEIVAVDDAAVAVIRNAAWQMREVVSIASDYHTHQGRVLGPAEFEENRREIAAARSALGKLADLASRLG